MGGLPTEKTIYTFAYDPKTPRVMYAALREGLFLSKDEGKHWAHLDKSPKGIVTMAIHPKDPKKIFAGAGDGKIYLSRDGGSTWKLQNR